ARVDQGREPRGSRLLSTVTGFGSGLLSAIRSGRSHVTGWLAPAANARPALSAARVPQSGPARRNHVGVCADEPERGRETRATRPRRERAREDVLDPRGCAWLPRRLQSK